MATRKKKQTLAEFRAWLSGVEELQPEGWAPDAAQWVLIREKINNISEPKTPAGDTMIEKLIAGMNNAGQGHMPPQRGNPYGGHAPNLPPPPAPAGGVPVGPVETTPAAAAILPPAKPVNIEAAAKPRDSGDGNYNTAFS